MRRTPSRTWSYVRATMVDPYHILTLTSSGVFEVEGPEDIAHEGRALGIIRSTDLTGDNGDMISVLWLYTTKYLRALTDVATGLIQNKQA